MALAGVVPLACLEPWRERRVGAFGLILSRLSPKRPTDVAPGARHRAQDPKPCWLKCVGATWGSAQLLGPKRSMTKSAKRNKSCVVAAPRVASAQNTPTIKKEEGASETPAKRRLRARTTEEDVFKSERLPHNLVNGVRLHSQREKDVHGRGHAGGEAPTMGKAYYVDLRLRWPFSSSAMASRLAVADASDLQDEDLDAALEGVVAHRKSFARLLEWFENSALPNQKVMVCVSKATVIHVKLNTSERVDVVLAHMKWVHMHGLVGICEKECAAVRDLWVSACCRSLSNYTVNGMTTNRWWSEFKGIGSLLVDADACDECMKNISPDWGPVEPRL